MFWDRPKPRCRYVWDPKPDITPYELARALIVLCARSEYSGVDIVARVDAFPPQVRRHFREERP